MSAAECASSGEAGLESEILPLMSLVHHGSPEAQTAYRLGVNQHPAGLLLEQLLTDVTIVHSLPKCGGTTIAATLNASPAVRPEALHLHYLSPRGLAFLEGQIAECDHPNVRYLQTQLAQGRGARALLAANRALRTSGMSAAVRKPYLIAGVREPVALYLSLAFEGSSIVGAADTLTAEYLHHWVTSDPLSRVWDDWFTDELGVVSDVDVYARPFPTQQGWDVYETDAARVLVVRQENFTHLPDALGELYGSAAAPFRVKTRNVAAKKSYADRYAKAKRALRLTDEELDRVYATRFVRHFYSDSEIVEFKHRWRIRGSETARAAKPSSEARAPAPARSDSTCAVPSGTTPHPWGCRPCACCAQQLHAIPGLHNACAEQADEIRRLRAELDSVRRVKGFVASKFRSLARRLTRA